MTMDGTISKGRSSWPALAAFFMLIAFCGILLSTPYGIGLSPDSISYVAGARSLLERAEFSTPYADEPITHFPPGYSLVLAAAGLAGWDPAEGARWIAGGLFAFNLFLIYRIVGRFTGGSGEIPWFAVLIVGFGLTARPFWEIHLMAWSEPAFLALFLVGLLFLSRFLEDLDQLSLFAAGLAVGLAIVTRYAGLSIWGAFCLALILFSGGSLLRRFSNVLVFGGVALIPFAIWAARNYFVAGTATNRAGSLHLITWDRLHDGLATAAAWLMVPNHVGGFIKVALLGGVSLLLAAGVYLWLVWKHQIPLRFALDYVPGSVKIAAVSAVAYVAFLVVSISLVDANTPLDQRILSPLFTLLVILAAYGLYCWVLAVEKPAFRASAIALVCLAALLHLTMSYPLVSRSFSEGLGFSNLRWAESPLIQEVRQFDGERVLYSNSADALHYLTGRNVKRLPVPFAAVTQSENPRYPEELDDLRKDLEKGGLLVWLDFGTAGSDKRASRLMSDIGGLTALSRYPDGEILGCRDSGD